MTRTMQSQRETLAAIDADLDRASELHVSIAVGREDSEEFSIPTAELPPVCTTDRFKRIVKEARDLIPFPTVSWPVEWQPAPTTKESFIENASRKDHATSLAAMRPNFQPNPNLLAVGNYGGIKNGGVCWWHSRFTRAALCLAYFLPDEPEPTEAEAAKIVSTLMSARAVVAIPGFRNLYEFSGKHWNLIQKKLEQTQILEAIFLFAWVNGLAGAEALPPDKMKMHMDEIYEEVSQNGIAYVKLQTPGIESHSWLITQMVATEGGGYLCQFIDSNADKPYTYEYKPTDTYISFKEPASMGIPYLQRSWELQRMRRIVRRFCERGAGAEPI